MQQLQYAVDIDTRPRPSPPATASHSRRRHGCGIWSPTRAPACRSAYLATHQPSFTGAPRTVIVTIDLATLEARLHDTVATLPSGATLAAETARRLACDAELIPVVLGCAGELLDIGQADHEFTTAIRRAAYIRDRGRCASARRSDTGERSALGRYSERSERAVPATYGQVRTADKSNDISGRHSRPARKRSAT